MSKDKGFTVAKCRSGLAAAEALAVGGSAAWDSVAKQWRDQLAFALARPEREPGEGVTDMMARRFGPAPYGKAVFDQLEEEGYDFT